MGFSLVRFCGVASFRALASFLPRGGVKIRVEGPQDSLAQPPQDLNMNHCTLRKALFSANNDSSAAYPQCASGSGLDTITFNSAFTITLTIARADQADGGTSGDFNITDSLIT